MVLEKREAPDTNLVAPKWRSDRRPICECIVSGQCRREEPLQQSDSRVEDNATLSSSVRPCADLVVIDNSGVDPLDEVRGG